jgi:osmotically-inducible protein OsmY
MESMTDDRIRIDQAAGVSPEVLQRVKSTLSRSCHFTRHWREIRCDYEGGILTLHGNVPSFYLKQVLQSILKDVPGVARIDNRVEVVSAAGLSSVRRSR